jgi:hypothetical protein
MKVFFSDNLQCSIEAPYSINQDVQFVVAELIGFKAPGRQAQANRSKRTDPGFGGGNLALI